MIDAERMLGSLVRDALGGGRRRRRRRRSILGVSRGALGLGALGVAIAAFEHLTQAKAAAGGAPASSGSEALPPLPVPPAAGPGGGSEMLPPVPMLPGDEPSGGREALLLVRAMIAAANADHEVDDAERQRIVAALEDSGTSEQEREFVLAELETPVGLGELARQAATPELARQVYLASLMAIEVDTTAESNYLTRLAGRLGLDGEQLRELHALLEERED